MLFVLCFFDRELSFKAMPRPRYLQRLASKWQALFEHPHQCFIGRAQQIIAAANSYNEIMLPLLVFVRDGSQWLI